MARAESCIMLPPKELWPSKSPKRSGPIGPRTPPAGGPLHLTFNHLRLDRGDCLGGVQALRARLGAVHDGVAAVELERVLERIEALAVCLVARIDQPAPRLQQRRRAEITLRVPPVARACCRAAGAQDALVKPVELVAVVLRLPPLLLRRGRHGLQPRLH